MLLREVPSAVAKLSKLHSSHDPFKIANDLDIQILTNDFGDDVFGFYNKVSRIKFIHLNSRLTEDETRFVCAHELIHAVFHPNENTPQLSRINLNSTSKIEAQANCGATCLLIDGSHKDELYQPTKQDILNYYAIPLEMELYI